MSRGRIESLETKRILRQSWDFCVCVGGRVGSNPDGGRRAWQIPQHEALALRLAAEGTQISYLATCKTDRGTAVLQSTLQTQLCLSTLWGHFGFPLVDIAKIIPRDLGVTDLRLPCFITAELKTPTPAVGSLWSQLFFSEFPSSLPTQTEKHKKRKPPAFQDDDVLESDSAPFP